MISAANGKTIESGLSHLPDEHAADILVLPVAFTEAVEAAVGARVREG